MPRPSASAAPMKARPNWASAADGVAQGARQEVAEDRADADGGGAHADGGEAGTDILGRVDIAGGEFTGSRGIH